MPEHAPVWQELPSEDRLVWEAAIRQSDFVCPHCHEPEPWNALRCTRKRVIFGPPVYRVTQRMESGFVLFRKRSDQVSVCQPQRPVVRLSEDSLAVRCGQQTRCFQYDRNEDFWRMIPRSLSPYMPIGTDEYLAEF